ncbi:MAG: hypothetical protein D3912_14310 [Candidatus Electrothrix sp. AX1]|nr:hypothetical protein [Candidatus Electrothrix sp. AX1]
MNEIIIGIDLGTTNSEVAVIQDAHPVLLKNQDSVILPSYVGVGTDTLPDLADGTVSDEIRTGFQQQGKVMRLADVRVNRLQ